MPRLQPTGARSAGPCYNSGVRRSQNTARKGVHARAFGGTAADPLGFAFQTVSHSRSRSPAVLAGRGPAWNEIADRVGTRDMGRRRVHLHSRARVGTRGRCAIVWIRSIDHALYDGWIDVIRRFGIRLAQCGPVRTDSDLPRGPGGGRGGGRRADRAQHVFLSAGRRLEGRWAAARGDRPPVLDRGGGRWTAREGGERGADHPVAEGGRP